MLKAMARSGHAHLHDQRKGDAFMSTATVTEAPATTAAPVTPELPDWLDGSTEVLLPTRRHLRAYWDADILDIDDKNVHDTIIERSDAFDVRFRVYLKGRLWNCIGGRWCFDVCFTAIGDGPDFNLSNVLPNPAELEIADWNGCRTRYIDLCVTVPPCTVPAESCGTLYQVGAKFELRCCDNYEERGEVAVAGHEPQGEYMFV
jgi:hypothetical protein